MRSAVAQLFFGGDFDQFLGLGDAGGQRLFADHVLARQQRVLRHGEMQRVGRADVNGIDGRIFQDAVIIRLAPSHAELGGELIGFFDLWLADGIELNVAQPANSFQMNPADEAGSEQRGFEFLHDCLASTECLIYRKNW